jgi:ketosteroid isomerase-like protein
MIVKIGALACALLASTAAYAAPDTATVKQTVRALLKASSDGDYAAVAALETAQGSIIDAFAPYRWDSFKDWGAAYGTFAAQNGDAHWKMTPRKFSHVNVEGERAYVVAIVAGSYTERGRPRKENGTATFTLEKQEGHWRVASYAWMSKAGVDNGADASAVVAAVHAFTSMAGTPQPAPTAIVDEFAPYHWTGPTANADWYAGLQKGMAAENATDIALKLAAPDQLGVNGDKAYAVFPTIITDKKNGKPTSEHGQFAFALEKSDAAWHITSWAWATR